MRRSVGMRCWWRARVGQRRGDRRRVLGQRRVLRGRYAGGDREVVALRMDRDLEHGRGPEGLYSVRSRAKTRPASRTVTARRIRVDNTAPTASMLVPSNNASVKGNAVVLDAGASDNVAVTGVEFRLRAGSCPTRCSGPGPRRSTAGSSNGTPTHDAETYQVRGVAFDAAGNTTTSPPINVTVDRTPPTTAVIVPYNDNTTVSGNAVFDAPATDNTKVTHVEFRATIRSTKRSSAQGG